MHVREYGSMTSQATSTAPFSYPKMFGKPRRDAGDPSALLS